MDSLFQAGAWRVAAAAGYSFPAAMSTESRLELRSRRTRLESPRSSEDTLPAVDLLVDFADAGARLRAHLPSVRTRDDVFDAFLLAAGLHQMLADHLHRDVRSLGKVARHLPDVVGTRIAAPTAGAAHGVRAAGLAARARRPSERALIRWEVALGAFFINNRTEVSGAPKE